MTRFRTSSNPSISLPYEGIDLQTPLPTLPPTRAPWIENFVIDGQTISVRNGSRIDSEFGGATSVIGNGPLIAYPQRDGANKLFGVLSYNSSSNSIVDWSSGVATIAAATSVSASFPANAIFFNNYLYFFDGGNTPTYYNGVTWTSGAPFSGPAFSSGSAAGVLSGCPYRNRLYLIPRFGTSIWYGGVGSVSGAMTEFNIGSLLEFGGYLWDSYPISYGDNAAANQYLALVSSEGEVLFYQGAYPGSPDWTIVTKAKIGKPLSYQADIQFQGDTLLVTSTGLVSLREVLRIGGNAGLYATISQPIDPLWKTLTREILSLGVRYQVSAIYLARNGKIYICFPINFRRSGNESSTSVSYQNLVLVYDTLVGAWAAETYQETTALTSKAFISLVEFGQKLIASPLTSNFTVELAKEQVHNDVNLTTSTLQNAIIGSIVSSAFISPVSGGVNKTNMFSLYGYMGPSVTSAISCQLIENFGTGVTGRSRPQVIINSFNRVPMSIGSVAPYVQYLMTAETNSNTGKSTTLYSMNILKEDGGFG